MYPHFIAAQRRVTRRNAAYAMFSPYVRGVVVVDYRFYDGHAYTHVRASAYLAPSSSRCRCTMCDNATRANERARDRYYHQRALLRLLTCERSNFSDLRDISYRRISRRVINCRAFRWNVRSRAADTRAPFRNDIAKRVRISRTRHFYRRLPYLLSHKFPMNHPENADIVYFRPNRPNRPN